jgi:hypothetical protein
MKIRTAIIALASLSLVWGLVWGVRQTIASQVPTPSRVAEKMTRFLTLAADDRLSAIEQLARNYSRLSFLQKRQFRSAHRAEWDKFLAQLSPAEKEHLSAKIFPVRFTQLMSAFDRLTVERRAEHLERALQEFTTNSTDSQNTLMLEKFAPAIIAEVSKNGLAAQFQKMPLETKLIFLPMIEQLQNNLRRMRD